MRNVCVKTEPMNSGIFSVQCESTNEQDNHWIYNNKDMSLKVAKIMEKFLIQKDGVDVLYKNAEEIGMGLELPSKRGSA